MEEEKNECQRFNGRCQRNSKKEIERKFSKTFSLINKEERIRGRKNKRTKKGGRQIEQD